MQKGFVNKGNKVEPLPAGPEGIHDVVLSSKKGGSAYNLTTAGLAKFCEIRCKANCGGECLVVATKSPGKMVWGDQFKLGLRDKFITLKEFVSKNLPQPTSA